MGKMRKYESKVEEWRDIPNYEGYYQVSDLGNIRSLDRTITIKNGGRRFYKGRPIEGHINKEGYRRTGLSRDGKGRGFKFSQLVAMAFLGHKPNGVAIVVDHIDGDVTNDRLTNLRVVTFRENRSTCFMSNKQTFSSIYAGVYWHERDCKWMAQIRLHDRRFNLGSFDDEIEASNSYKEALSKIKDNSFNSDDYKPKFSSKYKGISYAKSNNKWKAYIVINGKKKHLGYFKTESEAHEAYQNKLNELNNTKKETHGC